MAELGVDIRIVRVATVQTSDLSFGEILIDDRGGSVFMNDDGTIDVTSEIVAARGSPRRGEVTVDVSGTGQPVTVVVLSDPTVILTGRNTGGTVDFYPSITNSTMTTSEASTAYVHGYVFFPQGTLTDTYEGVLTVYVEYQ